MVDESAAPFPGMKDYLATERYILFLSLIINFSEHLLEGSLAECDCEH